MVGLPAVLPIEATIQHTDWEKYRVQAPMSLVRSAWSSTGGNLQRNKEKSMLSSKPSDVLISPVDDALYRAGLALKTKKVCQRKERDDDGFKDKDANAHRCVHCESLGCECATLDCVE